MKDTVFHSQAIRWFILVLQITSFLWRNIISWEKKRKNHPPNRQIIGFGS